METHYEIIRKKILANHAGCYISWLYKHSLELNQDPVFNFLWRIANILILAKEHRKWWIKTFKLQ